MFCVLATPLIAETVAVPSGQEVTLTDVLIDETPGEVWARFRFLAPAIARDGGRITPDMAAADMDVLCTALALPYLAEHRLDVARIVVSLADRHVEFGEADPDATQFFEAYRPENGRCIWEEF